MIWISTLCAIGVLPFLLLLATTGFSIWTISGLIWFFIATVYVAIVLAWVDKTGEIQRKREILWHAGLRLGYAIFAMVLFFILQVDIVGMIALILPILPDSANEWFIAPRTRKYVLLRIPVLIFVVLILLWLNSRLA